MVAKVFLFSNKNGEIDNFLSKFYSSHLSTKDSFSWKKDFPNPIEISEIIAAFSIGKLDKTRYNVFKCIIMSEKRKTGDIHEKRENYNRFCQCDRGIISTTGDLFYDTCQR